MKTKFEMIPQEGPVTRTISYELKCPTCGSKTEHSDVMERLVKRELFDEVRAIAKGYGVTVEDVTSTRRHRNTAHARHACWAWLRRKGYSLPEIGRLWGVDHTSVMTAVKKHAAKIDKLRVTPDVVEEGEATT